MSKAWVPASGDLIFLDFDPQAGHEQAGRRPALVLSEVSYNARVGLAIVCPITSQIKGYPFEVPIPGQSKINGAVLADQVKSIDWKVRKAKYVAPAPRGVRDTVRRYLGLILNLQKG